MLMTQSASSACGERWRTRQVLTDKCKCSMRHCGSWYDVKTTGTNSLPTTGATARIATTGADAACNAGANAHYSSKCARTTQDAAGAVVIFSQQMLVLRTRLVQAR